MSDPIKDVLVEIGRRAAELLDRRAAGMRLIVFVPRDGQILFVPSDWDWTELYREGGFVSAAREACQMLANTGAAPIGGMLTMLEERSVLVFGLGWAESISQDGTHKPLVDATSTIISAPVQGDLS